MRKDVLLAISKTWIVLRAKLLLQDVAGRTTVIYKMLWAELLLRIRCCRTELPLLTRCCGQNYSYLQHAVEQNYCYIYFQEGLSAEIVIQCSNETRDFLLNSVDILLYKFTHNSIAPRGIFRVYER